MVETLEEMKPQQEDHRSRRDEASLADPKDRARRGRQHRPREAHRRRHGSASQRSACRASGDVNGRAQVQAQVTASRPDEVLTSHSLSQRRTCASASKKSFKLDVKAASQHVRRTFAKASVSRRAREGRARRGEPSSRRLDREKIHEPRPPVPRPHSGGEHRPHEGGRQVRVQARLQVQHVRNVVDSSGHHARHRRSGSHHPYPGAHDRDDQQAHPHELAISFRSTAASRRRKRSPRRWSFRSTRSARS